MESNRCMWARWTHYITNDESPFWRHVKSNKCFRESSVYHRHHLSIVCCHVLCSSSSFCYMMLKDQQNPRGCSPISLVVYGYQTKQIISLQTTQTIYSRIVCVVTNCIHIEIQNRGQNTVCILCKQIPFIYLFWFGICQDIM